jgi:ornithine cyclodeaminase/alanine dehydrogenase-like protein (mu-crystallin family)
MNPMNRRTFVSSLAAAGAVIATGSRLLADEPKPRAKVGIIGCGWYGGVNLDAFRRNVDFDVVSLCDVNEVSSRRRFRLSPSSRRSAPRTFVDYREMLSSGGHDIVIVATPDHWHALPAIAAMRQARTYIWRSPSVST